MPLIKLVSYIYSYLFYLYTLLYVQRIQNKKAQTIHVLDTGHQSMKSTWLNEYKGCPAPTAPLPQ